jgi:alpha-beta hydrolase superfamily lysophospholipase
VTLAHNVRTKRHEPGSSDAHISALRCSVCGVAAKRPRAQIARSGLAMLAQSRTERRVSRQSNRAQNRRYVSPTGLGRGNCWFSTLRVAPQSVGSLFEGERSYSCASLGLVAKSTFTVLGRGDAALFVRHWPSRSEAWAVVQISHGMGEHSGRYARLAAALGADGFEVYAHDHRGHGRSVRNANEFGHFGPDGWNALVADLVTVGEVIDARSGGAARVLLGHSMGSFAVQQYLLDHSADIAAAVLTGTSALDAVFGRLDADASLDRMPENESFEGRTDFDWLSRDADEVDRYIADPACGFSADADALADMAVASTRPVDADALRGIRPDLPILLMSGIADPLSGAMALVELVGQRYRDAGVRDVSVLGYQGARHEVFNETNRADVTADLIRWLKRHTESRRQP